MQDVNIDEELRKAMKLVKDLRLLQARVSVISVVPPPTPVGAERLSQISLELTESSSDEEEVVVIPAARQDRRYREALPDLGRRQDFFSQIAILSLAERASKDDLFRSAIYLFEGNAKIWYMASREKLRNWDDLVRKLKDQFLPKDFDYWLMNDIETRYQGSSESFSLYLSHMEIKFQQLTYPIPEA